MESGNPVVDVPDAEMRSEDGEGGCAPCAQYSWETSQHGTLTVDETNQLLSSQLDIRIPTPPGASAAGGGSDATVDFKWDGNDTMEENLTSWWKLVEQDVQNHRDVLSYHLLPYNENDATNERPLFLAAVCFVMRARFLGRDVCVSLDPRWMGVPGTQYGMRCQMRQLIARCEQVSPADICRYYRETAGPLMTV